MPISELAMPSHQTSETEYTSDVATTSSDEDEETEKDSGLTITTSSEKSECRNCKTCVPSKSEIKFEKSEHRDSHNHTSTQSVLKV